MSVKRYEWVACDEHACHCDVVESAEGDMVDYEDYAALEARCAALAEENAGLKSAIDAAIGWQQSTDSENVESVRMLVDVKSPATDAFLAEVRAQGVEMFASKCKEESKRAHSSDARDSWWVSGENAEDFAVQLRKGVQS